MPWRRLLRFSPCFRNLPELAIQAVGGDFVVQVAGGQLVPAGPELLHGQDDVDHQGPLKYLQQDPDQHPAAAVGDGIKGAQELQQAQAQEAQPRRPEPQEEVQQSVPQVPGPGDPPSEAAEGEVLPQHPRPVPPGQGDAAYGQQGHRHPGADEGPGGQDGQGILCFRGDVQPAQKEPEDGHHGHADSQQVCGNLSVQPGEGQGPVLVPPVAGAIDQQGQGQGAQHPAGHGGDEKIVSGR